MKGAKQSRPSIEYVLFLIIPTVMQVMLVAAYVLLVIRPFYQNGLDTRPVQEVMSGWHDPSYLHPFCYTPPDVPDWYYSRCADGTQGNPNGDSLYLFARMAACLCPWVSAGLAILTVVVLLRSWKWLQWDARVLGAVGGAIWIVAFIFMFHRWYLFLTWILD
jgi:hypothetical protein